MQTRIAPEMDVSFSWKFADEHPPDWPAIRWADRLAFLWSYPVLRHWPTNVVLCVSIALICAGRAFAGLTGVQIFSHDAFMPLDGAWRILNGQRPHFDFYSFVGVLAYAPTALGLVLAHGASQGFAYAQALQSLALGLWAYSLSRKRLPDVPTVLFSLAIALLSAAPFPLGYSPLGISPATTYNRYGYAALALVMLEAFAQRKKADFRGGVSTGALLVLLLFLKASYFAGAALLIVLMVGCRAQTLRRWAGMVAGAAFTMTPFLLYYGFNLLPMFRDLATVAGAKRVHPRNYLIDSILGDAVATLAFGAVTAAVLFASRRGAQARATLIACVTVSVAGALLILGNCEPHGLPLSLFFLLITAAQLDFRAAGIPQLFRAVVLLWVGVFAAASLAPSVVSLSYAVFVKSASRSEPGLASNSLQSFVPISGDYAYQQFVNDGIALLNRHRAAGDSVMSLDFTNPFSYGLGMKPAPGGTTALHYQTTFDDRHRPPAERLFGAAKLVMVPKTFSDPTLQDSIPRLYGPYLGSHFRLVEDSAQWRLYRTLGM